MHTLQFITLAFATAVTAQLAGSQIPDGQVQAVSQIHDGQVQAVSAAPVVPKTSAAPVAPVKQITDGQIQVVSTTAAPVAPVKQITDGQIQVVSSAAPVAPVKQITDGQIQVVSSAAPAPVVVTSVPSAKPVAPTNGTITSTVPKPSSFTGAASLMSWSMTAVAAVGAAALFAML